LFSFLIVSDVSGSGQEYNVNGQFIIKVVGGQFQEWQKCMVSELMTSLTVSRVAKVHGQ
jgi:hypothetical protein